jgi:hypothetical protein
MLKLKSVTPSLSIKNGSFETWVLDVVSAVKVAKAESALPSYMYLVNVNAYAKSPLFSNKLKEKGKENSEDDDDEGDLDHETLLCTVVLN